MIFTVCTVVTANNPIVNLFVQDLLDVGADALKVKNHNTEIKGVCTFCSKRMKVKAFVCLVKLFILTKYKIQNVGSTVRPSSY